MILAINKFNINQNAQSKSKISYAKSNGLSQDTFVPQKNYEPSFGEINSRIIIKNCETFTKLIEHKPTINRTSDIIYNSWLKFQKLLGVPKKDSVIEEDFYGSLRHELLDPIQNRIQYLINGEGGEYQIKDLYPNKVDVNTKEKYSEFLKSEAKGLCNEVKNGVSDWEVLEKWWGKTDLVVPFEKVWEKFDRIGEKIPSSELKIKGLELVKDKSVKNPALLYDTVSQLFGNTEKYRNKGLVERFDGRAEIEIKKVKYKGKNIYTISFTNPDIEAYSLEEIEKLQEGIKNYRPESVKESGIYGTGYGLPKVIKTLKANDYEYFVENLFEKNREKGVKITIPLIGIQPTKDKKFLKPLRKLYYSLIASKHSEQIVS